MKDQSEIKQLNATIRKFWEIEDVSTPETKPILSIGDQIAIKNTRESIKYENGMYEVAVTWRDCQKNLKDNYDLPLRRLQNTEQKLQKNTDVGTAYN